jgi:hypothetical protein
MHVYVDNFFCTNFKPLKVVYFGTEGVCVNGETELKEDRNKHRISYLP